MPKRAASTGEDVKLDLGELNPKQIEAWQAIKTHKFTCYGGAKAGGKSHLARVFAIMMCYKYAGISLLFVRATYEDIRQNQIEPILKLLPQPLLHRDRHKARNRLSLRRVLRTTAQQ